MAEYRWYKSYDPGVPHSLEPYPRKTILDVVKEATQERPDYPMLIFQDREMTYREMEKESDALAAALAEMGVKKGDRIAVLFLNCPQQYIIFFAAWKIGAIVAPINPLYTEFEIEARLNEIEAETAVVLNLWYDMVKRLQKTTHVKNIIMTEFDDYTTPGKEKPAVAVESDDHWWLDITRRYAGKKGPAVEVQPEDTALILFSGGTTGVPKGVMESHHSLVITGMQVEAWFKEISLWWDEKFLVPLPLFHVFGIYASFGMALVQHNISVLIANPRDVKDIIETVKKQKITNTGGAPTMFMSIMEHPDLKMGDLKTMRMATSGAAPLLREVKEAFEKHISGRLTEGYGLTESGLAMLTTPAKGKWKEGSIGLPLPDTIVRIVDIETGRNEMPVNEPGELIMKAPQLMQGYWKRPEETREVLRDGWLYTGDIGYMDEDGYVFLTSRKKDVIKCSGFQVWPREVEEILQEHPAVAEVCVGGIPDPRQTEAVKAWIVLKEGQTVTAEDLQQFCRRKLTGYKVPRHIEFRKELPKTFVGKVLRRVLQEEERVDNPAGN
ncbi:MAG: long-chain fatty acid--CoA ligase [Deltaproteobacteria bacterium]|nr:long-chain fatty acid--CoA ligase [Deltaproteobacteria bacterium]